MHRLAALAVVAACSSPEPACDAGAPCDAAPVAWRLGPALPRPALAAGVTLYRNQVVVVGGRDGTAVTPRVDGFHLATETWQALPSAPVAWTSPGVAVVGSGLFLAGGLDATGVVRGEAYLLDPGESIWRPLAAMPPGDERGAAGVASGAGRLFLLGGASATGAVASCLEYDVIANQWTRLPDLPVARSHAAAMRRADGSLIVAGGFAGPGASGPLDDVWVLPPSGGASRQWQPGASLPAGAGGCAYGVVLGQLVCAGGQAGADARASVESYQPYIDEWRVREPMPVARTAAQAAASGGRLYVPGGADATGAPTDTLYIFAPIDTAR